MKREKKETASKIEAVTTFIKALHLKDLPNSYKVNLLCSLMLLIALFIVVAEPIFAYIDSIMVSICNACITIFSERDLLPQRTVDDGIVVIACAIAFVTELILCPTVVFIFGGFKNMTNGKTG